MKHLIMSFVFVFGLSMFFSPNGEVSADELQSTDEELQLPQYYDENNEPIYPYTEEELREMMESEVTVNPLAAWKKYKFGKTSFNNNINIKGGASFKNPGIVLINPAKEVPAMTVKAYKSGKQVGKLQLPGGWTSGTATTWSHLPRGSSYSFNISSDTGKLISLAGGEVWYDN